MRLQVLTQSRDELIERTFEALRGAEERDRASLQLDLDLQRRVVFGLDEEGIAGIAERGTLRDTMRADKVYRDEDPLRVLARELHRYRAAVFAKRACEAVMAIWSAGRRTADDLNLPATVEMSTPNIYADQIEWFCRNVSNRDCVIISVHPHNDRGTGVAAAELA